MLSSRERTKPGEIYAKINAIMLEVDAIGKNTKNQTQGWFFRGIDAVMNELHPLLAKHGVFLTAEIVSHHQEERTTKGGAILIYSNLLMRYRMYATDGSFVETEAYGEGMDSGDKSSNKAMSVAMKYALLQMLCIPTEAVDPDLDRPEGKEGLEKSSAPKLDSKAWAAKVISQIATSDGKELEIIFKSIQQEKDQTARDRVSAMYFNRRIELATSENDLVAVFRQIEETKQPEVVRDACRDNYSARRKEILANKRS